MISYELWYENKLIDVAIQKELPRVGERIICNQGHCKVKRVHFVLNQIPKVFVERDVDYYGSH